MSTARQILRARKLPRTALHADLASFSLLEGIRAPEASVGDKDPTGRSRVTCREPAVVVRLRVGRSERDIMHAPPYAGGIGEVDLVIELLERGIRHGARKLYPKAHERQPAEECWVLALYRIADGGTEGHSGRAIHRSPFSVSKERV
jgi:hypothetical protein